MWILVNFGLHLFMWQFHFIQNLHYVRSILNVPYFQQHMSF